VTVVRPQVQISRGYIPRPAGPTLPVTVFPRVHIGRGWEGGQSPNPDGTPVRRLISTFNPASGYPFLPEVLPAMQGIEIKVVDKTGSVLATLSPVATCSNLVYRIDDDGGGSTVSTPATDPGVSQIVNQYGDVIDGRELQVWYGGLPMAWLRPLRPQLNYSTLTIECTDLANYYDQRYVGRWGTTPPDVITNGDFVTDITGWSASADANIYWQAAPAFSKGGALVVSSTSPTDAQNAYAKQTVTIPARSDPSFIWINAMVWVNAGLVAEPLGQRGMMAQFTEGGVVVWRQNISPDFTIQNQWQKLALKIFVPAGVTYVMELRLYGPAGYMIFDAVHGLREERLFFDQAQAGVIILGLSQHAQNVALGHVDLGLGVDISGADSDPFTRAYKYTERANILQAMQEIVRQRHSVHFHMQHNRVLRVFNDLGITPSNYIPIIHGVNMINPLWSFDGTRNADRVVALGTGEGLDYTEGLAQVTSSQLGLEFASATTAEGQYTPQTTAEGILRARQAPWTFSCSVHSSHLFDVNEQVRSMNLYPGRIVPVSLPPGPMGPISINENMMIVSMTLDPNKRVAQLQLNKIRPDEENV
jgi:hypothetical protein